MFSFMNKEEDMAKDEYREYPAIGSSEVVGSNIVTLDLPMLVGSFWVRRATRVTNGLMVETWQVLGIGFRTDFVCVGGKPHIRAWLGPLKGLTYREKARVKVAGLLGVDVDDVEIVVPTADTVDDPDIIFGELSREEMEAALNGLC